MARNGSAVARRAGYENNLALYGVGNGPELPERAWLEADGARDTIEQRWAEAEGRIEGTRASILLDDPEWEDPGPLPFQRRVYSLPELEQVLERAGLTLTGVYDAQGAERPPTVEQHEIYVVARK